MSGFLFWTCIAALAGVVVYVVGRYFTLWLQAYMTGTRINMLSLIAMTLRKIDPQSVVNCKLMTVQALSLIHI